MHDMDLNSFLYKDPVDVNPTTGQMLLSEPLMDEGVFSRSAILIIDRDKNDGHLGLCLNKGPICKLSDIIEDVKGAESVPLYQGGPVELDRLFILHTLGSVFNYTKELLPGLYIGAGEDEVLDYISGGGDVNGKLRLFLGYSGWSAGQLTSEILRNSWALNTHPEVFDMLKGNEDCYWRRQVERLGEDYKSWLIIPKYPSLN